MTRHGDVAVTNSATAHSGAPVHRVMNARLAKNVVGDVATLHYLQEVAKRTAIVAELKYVRISGGYRKLVHAA